MATLGSSYADFFLIDLDAPGGYARVAEVRTQQQGFPRSCAFKIMRPDIEYEKGLERFEDELKLLLDVTRDSDAPHAITRLYDSGFAPTELAESLQKQEAPRLDLEIISTGLNVENFLHQKSELQVSEARRWLPFLVVELAPFDNSLLRQIYNQPQEDPSGLFRLPTGEVITMAIQLLDVMEYLHKKHNRAYMDWKPEHIFWNGIKKQVKLIDWNVTTSLDDGQDRKQTIRDDLRLFCGAALYISLTFVDPENPTKPIGPRPTRELETPVPEIRRRYWTDNPIFYQRDSLLDSKIKDIIRQGLDPKQGFDSTQGLKKILIEYAQQELGVIEKELTLHTQPTSPYFKAITEMRMAQQQLFQAQRQLIEAVRENGANPEFTRLFDAIKRASMHFPISHLIENGDR
jgi:serine/threonine protein kinase